MQEQLNFWKTILNLLLLQFLIFSIIEDNDLNKEDWIEANTLSKIDEGLVVLKNVSMNQQFIEGNNNIIFRSKQFSEFTNLMILKVWKHAVGPEEIK